MKVICDFLKQVVKDLYRIDIEPEVSVAPEASGADFASNVAFRLSKVLKKNPITIAEEIVEAGNDTESEKGISGPRSFAPVFTGLTLFESPAGDSGHGPAMPFLLSAAAPGFLNFTMNNNYYLQILKGKGELSSRDLYSGQTVVCEFSDPNPFKVLHVGHLYTSIVGDSISRLFEYAGARVVRANFGGDVGLHVAKTMWALMQKDTSDLKIEDIAKCYIEGTAAYEENEDAKKKITELNKEIYNINAEDVHGTELADLYWRGREMSYEYFEDFYKCIGVNFDKFYPESTVASLGLAKVREELENGVYEKSDGAVVFRGEPHGLHTRVFINKEGVPTYETKDVGLIFQKWEDWHFDRSIVITGNEQLDYMKVVLKSIEQYAPELVSRTTHLTHGLVRLPGNVKMSSRLGNGLQAVDVLNLVSEELRNEYNSDNFIIALGAIKYAFLKYKIGGNIVFDPKESVKMTGNSGPYLQYSCVRAKKILEKIRVDVAFDQNSELNLFEKALMRKISEYNGVLGEAVEEMAPHKICTYLYELAQEFSRFYENCAVAGDERESLRGQIVKKYLDIMTHGLNLLGIEIPEEM